MSPWIGYCIQSKYLYGIKVLALFLKKINIAPKTHFGGLQKSCLPGLSFQGEGGGGRSLVMAHRNDWGTRWETPARSPAMRLRRIRETALEPATSSLGGRRLIL